VHYPTTLKDLIEICSAEGRGNMTAAGSHWSLSGAAIADSEFIETNDPNNEHPAMAHTLYEVIPGCLSQAVLDSFVRTRTPERYLVHVEAGKRIYQLYSELDYGDIDPVTKVARIPSLAAAIEQANGNAAYTMPMALPTMGSAGMQTIVGALTTGTHGNSLELSAVSACVRAIHLVADGGAHYWIEQRDKGPFGGGPLVDDDKLRGLYGEVGGEERPDRAFHIERDNDLFNAVLVSAGRFGVIYSVVLEVVPQFYLKQRVNLRTWQEVKAEIEELKGHRDGQAWPELLKHSDPAKPLDRTEYLQAVVCLTPESNGASNLCGVTKRWRLDYRPTDPQGRIIGRPERRGDPSGAHDARTGWLIFPNAGTQHAYSPSGPSLLESACMGAGGFAATALKQMEKELVEFVESNGEIIGPAMAAVAAAGGLGLLALLAVFVILIEVVRRLLEEIDDDSTLADTMEVAHRAFVTAREQIGGPAATFAWRMFVNGLFKLLQKDGEEMEAISYAILENHDYLDRNCNVELDSLEVFFDARGDRGQKLIPYIDALIAHEIALEVEGLAFCGYAALRFMGQTEALIGMQRWPLSVSVEVAGLHGVRGTNEMMDYASQLARDFNAGSILHWGQRNDYTAVELDRWFRYVEHSEDLNRWRAQLARITDNGRLNHFSNGQTMRWGLEVNA
jgi:hypothetical protein